MVVSQLILFDLSFDSGVVIYQLEVIIDSFELFVSEGMPAFDDPCRLGNAHVKRHKLLVLSGEGPYQEVVALEG